VNEATEHAWNFQREMPHVRPRAHVTVAEPYSGSLEGLITRFRWHLTALREWCKRLGMAQQEHRIDPDFNPDDEVVRRLTRTISQLIERPPSQHYHNGGNDKRTLNWLLGMVAALIVGGIGGGIVFYGKFTALQATVSSMMSAHEARITRLENINESRYREAP
jgi:hypothetical protein